MTSTSYLDELLSLDLIYYCRSDRLVERQNDMLLIELFAERRLRCNEFSVELRRNVKL